jgi:hypothetical protein
MIHLTQITHIMPMIACHSAKVITYETMLYGGGGRGRSGVDAQLVEDVADAFA